MGKLFKILCQFNILVILLAFIFLALLPQFNKAQALSSGFVKQKIVSGLANPTDFALLPDGRILVAEQGGLVRVIKNGDLLGQPFISLPVDTNGERGLLSVTVDPDFTNNHFIYLSYTNLSPLEVRVSRFTEAGDQAVLGSEVVLLKSTQPLNLVHQSYTLRFGPDGKLWISVGNNEIKANSQDLSSTNGKLLRINKDGTIPSDNPFFGQNGKRQEIWAYGLRNPFKYSFGPDGRILLGDVGDNNWEEVNSIIKGGNYGYPFFEGPCGSCPYINPLFAYPHNGESAAVVGGVTYTGNMFPADYKNSYLFSDYAKGFIRRLTFDSGGSVISDINFDENAGSTIAMHQDLQGAVYFLNFYPGELFRVTFSADNQQPVVKASANPNRGDVPLSVDFSSAGTVDPNGDPLSFSWDFGDGGSSTDSNPKHTYTSPGIYKAKLTVNDGKSSSVSDPLTIAVGQSYPVASIDTPTENSKYNAGNTINYSGSASDVEDGNLPDSAFSWTVLFHHGTHPHPYLLNQVGKSGSFVISDTNEADPDTFYEIQLTVTDLSGLKTTISRNIQPNKINLTLNSDPVGLTLNFDGFPVVTPFVTEAVVGFKRFIDAPSPQNFNGSSYQFLDWSDGGVQTHQIVTPSQDATISARYQNVGTGSGSLRVRVPLFDLGNFTGQYLNGVTVKLTDISGNTVVASQISTQRSDGQNGWVEFNSITPGTYGLMAYKPGYQGVWKKLDCDHPEGSFNNATITNFNTENFKAAWNNNVQVVSGQTVYCRDLGLINNNKGSISFRILQIALNPSGYSVAGYINGATVKLTDTSGNTVLATQLSSKRSDGEDGWVTFGNIDAGNYGLMAYKAGFNGYLKKISCNIEVNTESTIKNSNTEGMVAAWNNNASVSGGKTTYCYDLGLAPESSSSNSSVRIRIVEIDNNGYTGNFINDAVVKLTDQSGGTTLKTTTSGKQFGNEDGWAFFDGIAAGSYGIMAYRSGFDGVWKKLDCGHPEGSFNNATINNSTSEGYTAAWNNQVSVSENQTVYCTDLGIKDKVKANKGNLRLRATLFNSDNSWAGSYLNGITVKLTDSSGNIVIKSLTSSSQFGSEDGWVLFDGIDSGTYGVMAYKIGYQGVWKKISCDNPEGSFSDATINNGNSEGQVAAFNNLVEVVPGQTKYCNDLGLKKI